MSAQLVDKEEISFVRLEAPEQRAAEELPQPLCRIVRDLGEGREADLVHDTFTRLLELLKDLQDIKICDVKGDQLEGVVSAFASVQHKALDLASRIENQAPLLDEFSEGLVNELLDMNFALRHELRRAFETDIAGMCAALPAESAEARVAHAHGVLRNCFRQSAVLLARAFDPSLNEQDVFADATSRLEESIILRDALTSLLGYVEAATKMNFPQSVVCILEHLDDFRRDSRRYLMRRDWEMFDNIEHEILTTKNAYEFEDTAKRILVSLETLLGQVQMRAVFKDEATAKKSPEGVLAGLSRYLDGMRPAA